MSGTASSSPKTTKQRLQLPLNGTLYTTTRKVSPEKEMPEVGGTMESELGSRFAASRIIAVDTQPDAHDILVIQHAIIPDEAAQLASNWEHSTCDIGGRKFDTIQRTIILLASDYSESSPEIGSALVANPTGAPNLGSGYILQDRQGVKSGLPLEPVFRVERRSYIQRVVIRNVVPEADTGIAYQETITLYYRGEVVTGEATIETLIADPTNAYWSTDANGMGNAGEQLSECWFQVTNRQVIDITPAYEKESDRLRPSQFFCPQGTVTATVITSNNTPGVPDDPAPSAGQKISITARGRIKKVTTTTQSGTAQILRGMSLMENDGFIYPFNRTLIERSAVPTTKTQIGADGKVTIYQPIDGCHAAQVEEQGISLEDDFVKTAENLIPEKFLKDGKVTTKEVTAIVSTGEPTAPTPTEKEKKTVRKKGVVERTETITQTGTKETLVSMDYLPDDGRVYRGTEEVIPPGSVPPIAPDIDSEGKIETYDPINANWTSKKKRQAVSLENEEVRSASRTAPDLFFKTGKVTITTETTTGVSGAPPAAVANLKESVKITRKGRIQTKTTTRQDEDPTQLRGTTIDERTGESFIETTDIVELGAVAPVEIASDGTVETFDPVDANWAKKKRTKAVSTTPRTWTEVINYEWPAVLIDIVFKVWGRKDGGSVSYPVPRFKSGFAGPQLATVTQYWQKTQPVVIAPIQMVAKGFQYRCPLYSISVPACLHPAIPFNPQIGTEDPEWENYTDYEIFAATNYVDWPAEIFWREAKPYRGGFMVTEYLLKAPV